MGSKPVAVPAKVRVVRGESMPLLQAPLIPKVRATLSDGKMLTAKEIAKKLREDVHEIGSVLGNMQRRGQVVRVSAYRTRWKLP